MAVTPEALDAFVRFDESFLACTDTLVGFARAEASLAALVLRAEDAPLKGALTSSFGGVLMALAASFPRDDAVLAAGELENALRPALIAARHILPLGCFSDVAVPVVW